MEYIDIYDEFNNLKEKEVEREFAHDEGLWHREVLIIIVNNKKEILLQQRSYEKRFMPGKWALLGGHAITGQTPTTTALREINEEVGLKVNKDDLIFIKLFKRGDKKNKKFQYIYLVKTNNDISDYSINKNEVRQLKYFNISALKKRIMDKDYSLVFSKSPKFHLDLFNEILDILN